MSFNLAKITSLLKSPMSFWIMWVMVFYAVWMLLVGTDDLFNVFQNNWEIATSMLVGSYAAGSTPMGGGSVGFPILVMLMDMPANLGRDFSFAIQSIGMTSASILIFCRKQKVDMDLLRGAFAGAIIGTPVGLIFVAPYVDDLVMKLAFSVLWAGFGVIHLTRLKEISTHVGEVNHSVGRRRMLGFIAALFSTATICSVTGVGVDMVIYSILVLLLRADLKVAVPTSVIIMAFTSLVGVATKFLVGSFESGLYQNWLAAAPVVILGAPLGVLVVDFIGRKITLYIVSAICILQFIWVCSIEYKILGVIGVVVSVLTVLSVVFFLEKLRRKGISWELFHLESNSCSELSSVSQRRLVD